MKNSLKLLLILFVFTNAFSSLAQDTHLKTNYFLISPRVGYDIPTYNNNTPYTDYKGGLDLGISVDHYWNWFGVGGDFDYIVNKPNNNYPMSNLFESDGITSINTFALSENKIRRLFYGIGPNVQFRNDAGRFKVEINTRVGLASIKGGRVYLEGTSTTGNRFPLNFHAGYKTSQILTVKGQVRFTYVLNKNLGISSGTYYIKHFGVKELTESGVSALYQQVSLGTGTSGASINVLEASQLLRDESCDCDISSLGAFAGITYKFNEKDNKCDVCKEDHVPHCCSTCGCGITVTAKDKFTGETLANTDVVLKDLEGHIIESKTTNSYGVVVFNNVSEDNYVINGKLYNVSLEDETVSIEEFKFCGRDQSGIQKIITYTNEAFILKGNVLECNSNIGIEGVDIILKDKIKPGEKHTLADTKGDFIFHLNQASNYVLNGKKDGYYSNKIDVSTNNYNRKTDLFIDFEMCVDPCGKAIKLDNINFDLDRAEILPGSIPDLLRVVKLMRENPNIEVEMSSHTDSQGSDAYNQELSQRRANATVNYIAQQGISRNRLIARGAGENELKNKRCVNNVECLDEEHRINRRTEFKVVCY